MDVMVGFPLKIFFAREQKIFEKHSLLLCQGQQMHFLILTAAFVDSKT